MDGLGNIADLPPRYRVRGIEFNAHDADVRDRLQQAQDDICDGRLPAPERPYNLAGLGAKGHVLQGCSRPRIGVINTFNATPDPPSAVARVSNARVKNA